VKSSKRSSSSAKRRATAQITLLTDFGNSDYFVGALKGVILSINPAVSIVDITHEIPPQDITSAAFTLLASYQSFPVGTIHVVVVDPGVGSSRRAIAASAAGQFFVGPDNGLFSYVFECEPPQQIVQLTNQKYFRDPVSNTFHGRDIFAPVAASLSKGARLQSFGPALSDPIKLGSIIPTKLDNGNLEGKIIHVDHFGNCVTNFDKNALNGIPSPSLRLKRQRITRIQQSYNEGKRDGNLFAIWGSAGFLEISARERSAAKLLNLKRGDKVVLM
jgi:S-adenosyl-L-methionine hydrolase (adenosine-forming)